MTGFEKYVNMIRKSAHYYADKWNIDYDEVESQGFLIYCESLENYDVTKGNFSTHLTWELKRLNDFCTTYTRQKGYLIEDYFVKANDNHYKTSVCDRISAQSKNMSLTEILDFSVDYLSKEAYLMLEWILKREWERKGKKKPSISAAMKYFSYPRAKAENIWNELKHFYNVALISL